MVSAVGHDHKPAVEEVELAFSKAQASTRWARKAMGRQSSLLRGNLVDIAHRSTVARYAQKVPEWSYLLASFAAVGGGRSAGKYLANLAGRLGSTWTAEMGRDIYGWQLRTSKKRGLAVGKTKRGKGTKWMVVVDGQGIPLGILLETASRHEAPLAEATLNQIKVPRPRGRPRKRAPRVITDKAYDSDPLRRRLKRRGTELIAPYRSYKKNRPYADGRKLRRYRRRWIIERTNAWLSFFRRLAVRYDRIFIVYRGFFHIACLMITLRHL